MSFSEWNYQRSPRQEDRKKGVQGKFPVAPAHSTHGRGGRGGTTTIALQHSQQVSNLTTRGSQQSASTAAVSTRAVPGPHVPPSRARGDSGRWLFAHKWGDLDGRPVVGRARFTAGVVPRGGNTLSTHVGQPLSGCASRQLFPELLRPHGAWPTRSR